MKDNPKMIEERGFDDKSFRACRPTVEPLQCLPVVTVHDIATWELVGGASHVDEAR